MASVLSLLSQCLHFQLTKIYLIYSLFLTENDFKTYNLQIYHSGLIFQYIQHLNTITQVQAEFLKKQIESWSQTLIFYSLYLCNPMSQTLDISNHELYDLSLHHQVSKIQGNLSLWQRFNSLRYKYIRNKENNGLECLLVHFYICSTVLECRINTSGFYKRIHL